MHFVELTAVLAVLQFLCFGALTGSARGKSGVTAPAVSGHPDFERMYRVQMNTLELMVAFIPALFLAARYWSAELVASLGVVYLLGRILYWRAYVSEPSKRGVGFIVSMLPVAILSALALVGVVRSIIGF